MPIGAEEADRRRQKFYTEYLIAQLVTVGSFFLMTLMYLLLGMLVYNQLEGTRLLLQESRRVMRTRHCISSNHPQRFGTIWSISRTSTACCLRAEAQGHLVGLVVLPALGRALMRQAPRAR